MCGRYTLRASPQQLGLHFGLDSVPELRPRYNIAPTQIVPVVRAGAGGVRELVELRWGLIPGWSKTPPTGAPLINARSETAASKPTFRAAFRQRRCLLPADGFYEWQKLGTSRQAFHVHRPDGGLFGFAGLWEQCHDASGKTLETCTILTTAANELLRPLHERMPVIVAPADYAAWLDPAAADAVQVEPLLSGAAANELVISPVTTRVNSIAHDDAECLTPAEQQKGLFE
jgi:putative SOS response-associated peptidase YedK